MGKKEFSPGGKIVVSPIEAEEERNDDDLSTSSRLCTLLCDECIQTVKCLLIARFRHIVLIFSSLDFLFKLIVV